MKIKDNLKQTLSDSSLDDAYKLLLDNGIEQSINAYRNANVEDKKIGTTIRLSPQINEFYRTLSDALNISIQESISMTLEGSILAIIEKRNAPK